MLPTHEKLWTSVFKADDNCGANAPGGGGFQPGNDCAADKDGNQDLKNEYKDTYADERISRLQADADDGLLKKETAEALIKIAQKESHGYDPNRKPHEYFKGSRADFSKQTLYHASQQDIEGKPRLPFYLGSTSSLAKKAALAGGVSEIGDALYATRSSGDYKVSEWSVSPEAKVYGMDMHLEGFDLPESMSFDDFEKIKGEIKNTVWSEDSQVQETASELANKVYNRSYAVFKDKGGVWQAKKHKRLMQDDQNAMPPKPIGHKMSFGWKEMDSEVAQGKRLPDALRALGYDVAFVDDEAIKSVVALTDDAIQKKSTSVSKSKDNCGANAPGGGGFQPGNQCAADKDGDEPASGKRTKAFDEWFGDSKVVDENGDPLVVYHGVKDPKIKEIKDGKIVWDIGFDVFDTEGGMEAGAYFSPDINVAKKYGTPIPFYLRATSPIQKEDPISSAPHNADSIFRTRGKSNKIQDAWEIAVFNPSQIKMAVGNENPTDDPSIYKSKDNCGANAPGGGGFQPGNDCAADKDGGGDEPASGKRTKAFDEWFGDSKVVDENGDPLVLYHGTSQAFDDFSELKRGSLTDAESASMATFFTDDEKTANAYAIHAAEYGPVKDALDKANLAEKRQDWESYDKFIREAESLDAYDQKRQRRKDSAKTMKVYLRGDFMVVDAEGKTPQDWSNDENIDSWLTSKLKEAKAEGRDGVRFDNLDDAVGLYNRPATHFAVFNPDGNVKDIDNENPTDDPSIHKSADKPKSDCGATGGPGPGSGGFKPGNDCAADKNSKESGAGKKNNDKDIDEKNLDLFETKIKNRHLKIAIQEAAFTKNGTVDDRQVREAIKKDFEKNGYPDKPGLPSDLEEAAYQEALAYAQNNDWYREEAIDYENKHRERFLKQRTDRQSEDQANYATVKAQKQNVTKRQNDALADYAGAYSGHMGKIMRGDADQVQDGGQGEENKEWVNYLKTSINEIDKALESHSFDKDVRVYHGMEWKKVNAKSNKDLIGKTIHDPAFLSTTTRFETADRFDSKDWSKDDKIGFGGVIRLTIPKGTPAIAIGLRNPYWGDREQEVLLGGNYGIKIIAMNDYSSLEEGKRGIVFDAELVDMEKSKNKSMSIFKSESDCGANAPGGGGFQPGNDCAADKDGGGSAESQPESTELKKFLNSYNEDYGEEAESFSDIAGLPDDEELFNKLKDSLTAEEYLSLVENAGGNAVIAGYSVEELETEYGNPLHEALGRQEKLGFSIDGDPLKPGELTKYDGGNYEPEEAPDFDEFMRNQYPEGYSFIESGFLLADGTLLDMSHGSGSRADDHRSIIPSEAASKRWGFSEQEMEYRGSRMMATVRRAGALRIDGAAGLINSVEGNSITPAQRDKIQQYIDDYQPEQIYFDVDDGTARSVHGGTVDSPRNASQVINAMRDYDSSNKSLPRHETLWLSVFKSDDGPKSDCGANAPGGGGFQPGNDCAAGGQSISVADKGVANKTGDYAIDDDVPAKAGSVEIPDNHVRFFHYSSLRSEDSENTGDAFDDANKRAKSIRQSGIKMGSARGERFGEPNQIWATVTNVPDNIGEKVYVEFSLPFDDPRIGGTISGNKDVKEARSASQATFIGDIKPSEIIAVHEPWHKRFRYAVMDDDERTLDSKVLDRAASGYYDHILDPKKKHTSDYRAAYRRIIDIAKRRKKSLPCHESLWLSVFKSDDGPKSDCGANAPGGGGFQPGNDCAADQDGKKKKKSSKELFREEVLENAKNFPVTDEDVYDPEEVMYNYDDLSSSEQQEYDEYIDYSLEELEYIADEHEDEWKIADDEVYERATQAMIDDGIDINEMMENDEDAFYDLEQGYLDSAHQEVEEANYQARKEWWEDWSEMYRDEVRYDQYQVQEFFVDRFESTYIENPDGDGFVNTKNVGELGLNKWGKDKDGDFVLRFETEAGTPYTITTYDRSAQQGRTHRTIMFDQAGDYGIKGTGSAHEVFSKVIGAIASKHQEAPADVYTFTAAEPSRKTLYKRLVKKLGAVFPELKGAMYDRGGSATYVVGNRDYEELWSGEVDKKINDAEIILKSHFTKHFMDVVAESEAIYWQSVQKSGWEGSICKSKYDGIDFSVTPGMISAAKRGLELRKKHKRGGTRIGATRATQIVNRKKLSPDTWKRVFSYFSRHEVDKQGKGWGKDSAGYIAWLLWGGDAGFSRSRKITKQMKARDEKKSLPHHEKLWNSVFKAADPRRTPAPKKDQIKGSKKNKKGSAKNVSGKITFSEATTKKLSKLVKEHNAKGKGSKANLRQLKAVYRRGAGAFSTSHAPNMSRDGWAMARVRAFLHLLRTGSPKNAAYKQDNDLLPKGHKKKSEKKSLSDRENLRKPVFKSKSAEFDLKWPPEAARGVKSGQPSNDTPEIIERHRAFGELWDE